MALNDRAAKILNIAALLIGTGYLVFIITFSLSSSGQRSEAAFNNGYGFRKSISTSLKEQAIAVFRVRSIRALTMDQEGTIRRSVTGISPFQPQESSAPVRKK